MRGGEGPLSRFDAHPNVEAYKLVCVETTATVFGGAMHGEKI